MDGLGIDGLSAEDPSLHHPHETRPAMARATIMGDVNPIHQRGVEQKIATIGGKYVVVDTDFASFSHHSTSSRMGRVCLV